MEHLEVLTLDSRDDYESILMAKEKDLIDTYNYEWVSISDAHPIMFSNGLFFCFTVKAGYLV